MGDFEKLESKSNPSHTYNKFLIYPQPSRDLHTRITSPFASRPDRKKGKQKGKKNEKRYKGKRFVNKPVNGSWIS